MAGDSRPLDAESILIQIGALVVLELLPSLRLWLRQELPPEVLAKAREIRSRRRPGKRIV